MTCYITLLRAVNVGGTGKLSMAELKALCEGLGFKNVRTYIASGNVVFESTRSGDWVRKELETALARKASKPVGVLVRTGAEVAQVLAGNPFGNKPANQTVAIFLNSEPEPEISKRITGQVDEEIRLGKREIYVYYPSGQGRSKLKIRGAETGTARNMNTVAKLAQMAGV